MFRQIKCAEGTVQAFSLWRFIRLGWLFGLLAALFKFAGDSSLAVGQPWPGEGVRWWR